MVEVMHTDHDKATGKDLASTLFPKKTIKKKLFKDWGGLRAYLVDGKEVREQHDIDFTAGGNFGKYPFVPKNELWVDQYTDPREKLATLLHEMYEYRLISQGMKYGPAHVNACKVELVARANPKDVKKKVDQEACDLIELLKLRRKSK
jgi:hypothetical protein